MPNELEVGTTRNGQLHDQDASTPHVSVSLHRSEEELVATITWPDDSSPYAGWFLRDKPVRRSDSAPRKKMPSHMAFQDSHGFVQLIGCRPQGWRATFHGPGSGRIGVRFAIFGHVEGVDFSTINGLRTEITGLWAWLGISNVDVDFDKAKTVQVTATAAPNIEVVSGPISLSFIPTWGFKYGPENEYVQVADRVLVSSRSSEAVPWDRLRESHLAVRDLLLISRWRAESCVVTSALRDDAPITTLDGTTHGDDWKVVIEPGQKRTEPPSG